MNKNQLQDLSIVLGDMIKFPISIHKMIKENIEKYHTEYYISIWFNDMFGWAYSHALNFLSLNSSLEKLIGDFIKWYAFEGKKLMEKFNSVKYPKRNEKNQYHQKEVNIYFDENVEIVKPIIESINNYCKIEDLNDKF